MTKARRPRPVPIPSPTPTPIPTPIPAPSGLLAMAPTQRNTELPGWTYLASDMAYDPIYQPSSAVYQTIKNQIKPRIVRWMPWKTLDEGMPLATVQKVCATIRDWGAVLWVKGPTHGSDTPSGCHYMRGAYTDADLIAKYLALYDVLAAEFPAGFFAEHVNEADMAAGQAAAGILVADHWNKVFVPVRKAFTAKYPNCKVVWIAGSMTNIGAPKYGDIDKPYMEPTNAAIEWIKTAYSLASAADKPLFIPDVWSFHSYGCDASPTFISWSYAGLDGAAAFVGMAAKAFKVAADTAFPGAGIRIALSEQNVSQAGIWAKDWSVITPYYYAKLYQALVDAGVWLSVTFLANGDSRGWPNTTGCPDLVKDTGELIFGASEFVKWP